MQPSSPTFCVMPWTNLATETNGKCKVCCIVMSPKYIKKTDGTDFHIHENPIEEIFDSEHVQNVRKKMLSGEWHEDCTHCQQQEANNNISPRIQYNKQWYDKKAEKRVEHSKQNDFKLTPYLPDSLEPRPGITCNLQCNTCWSLSSSKIHSERKNALKGNLGEVPQFLKDTWAGEVAQAEASNFNWPNNEIYLNNVRSCMKDLKRLYFTGGEPALIPSNRKILKDLIDQKKTDLLVSFTTNLTVMDEELMDLLSYFSKVELSGSIDGFGAANEYIRYPTKWDDVVTNMHAILEKKFSFMVMSVIQIANIPSYLELLKWLRSQKITKETFVWPTMISSPHFLRPEILPPDIKKPALEELNQAMASAAILPSNKERLKDICNQLTIDPPDADRRLVQFREYIQYLDRTRNTNFVKTFPHLASLF